ncbi:YoaK family small membrane protein [Rahnella aceris]
MNLKFIPPIIVLIGAVGFMLWFFASGAAMPGG